MRITNVRFFNINSLKGDFEIDFTDPELAGRGIFAIMGRTGSGKTSILDAITLALFGKTPRLNFSAKENELMTRGTGFCQTEVTFEAVVDSRTLVFRSIWEQKRARNASSGKLQNARMQLVQVSEKQPRDQWESEKLSEVPVKVEEITGLNFERFTRTCLLAQGQFAAFLDAKPGDRAQILEQITGTEIYFQLSQAAFERDKAASAKVEDLRNQMQGIALLSEEEFAALKQRVDKLQQEREACDDRKQAIQRQISWINHLNSLLENRDTLLARRETLVEERETHGDEFRKLEMGRKAEPARHSLMQRAGIIQKLAKRETDLNEARERVPLALKACEESQMHLEQARAARAEFQKTAVLEQQRIKEARAVDQKAQGLREVRMKVVDQLNEIEKKRSEAEIQVQNAGKTIAELAMKKQALQTTLEKSAIDKTLGSDLKALENLATRHRETETQLSATEKELDSCRLRVASALEEVSKRAESARKAEREFHIIADEIDLGEKALSRQFSDASNQVLQERVMKAQKRQDAATTLQALGSELREAAGEEARLGKALEKRATEMVTTGEALEAFEKAAKALETGIEELSEQKIRLKTMASLEDHRHLLEDGKPCPLCGSLEHPFSIGIEGTSQLKEIEIRLKKAKADQKKHGESLKEAQKLLQSQSTAQAADESAFQGLRKMAAGLHKKWEVTAEALEESILPDDETRLATLAESAGKALKEAEAAFDDFQTATASLEKAGKALAKSREKHQQLEKEMATAQGTLKQQEALEQKTDQRLKELQKLIQETDERLRQEIMVYGFSEFDHEVLPKLKVRWASWEDFQKKLEQSIQDEHAAQNTLASASTQLEGFSRQCADLGEEVRKADAALEAVCTERRNLYQDRVPDEEDRKLQASAAELQARAENAVNQAQELRLKLESLLTTEKSLTDELEALGEELIEAQKALEAARELGGFADEASLLAAILPTDEIRRLSDLEKNFETQIAQLAGNLEGVEKQIADHEAGRPTSRSLVELTEDEKVLAAAAVQAQVAWQEEWKILATHQENRSRHCEIADRTQAAQQEGARWAKLNWLIGSASGKKFQEFAQGLTFSSLVYQANRQLEQLSDRYLLANEGLELQVIDRYIANARASAKNLSGGEKFLASLSLALGLAHMVGRKYRMDTLFIDEGFGALDPETLETALSVLCTLQQQGKLIGVISHVESLKDRLPARLEVNRLGGGHSTIVGPGCIRHS